MSNTQRGKRDGTGPYKDSYQRSKTGNKGRRILSGQKCPKSLLQQRKK